MDIDLIGINSSSVVSEFYRLMSAYAVPVQLAEAIGRFITIAYPEHSNCGDVNKGAFFDTILR